MNIVDYILLSVVFIYALLGFASGALTQICGLLAVAVSLLAGYLFYEKTGNLLFLPLVIIATGLIVKILIYLVRNIYLGLRTRRTNISYYSRMGGGLIAGLKGAGLVYIALVWIHLFSSVFAKIGLEVTVYLGNSYLYSQLKERDLFPGIKAVKNIHFVTKLLSRGSTQGLAQDDKLIRNLWKNSSFRAVVGDKELQRSIENKDYMKVLSDPKFRNLLSDKEFLQQLYNIDYEEVYKTQLRQKN